MLDFRVQTFLTVCRTLNYTRAAEELSITQPAVSQHIAYLEKTYGAKLFSMSGNRPALTQAGEALRRAFASMAHDERLLHEQVQALVHGGEILLRIGMTLTAGEYIVAAPLARFLAGHPEVRITLHSGDTAELLGLLDGGDLDCAFIEGPFDASVYRCDVYRVEQLVCVCPPGHRHAGQQRSVGDLLGEHLVVREKGSGTRAVLENALAARNLAIDSFAKTSEVSSIGVIKELVKHGVGISFLYRVAVEAEVERGELALIELAGNPIEHDIAFVRLPGSVFEEQLRRLFEGMRR